MAVRSGALQQSNTSVFSVTLTGYTDYEHSGYVYNPASDYVWFFDSTLMFVNILEAFFDHSDFPQATSTIRTFERKAWAGAAPSFDLENSGIRAGAVEMEKPTFIIRVQYRQNATWQGTIQWAEQKKTQQFRSVLEMIKLMEAAVDTASQAEEEPPKWAD